MITTAETMKFDRTGLTDDVLLMLYRGILKPRVIEEKMLILLRQGKISKWFSGIGQEAISVGATAALLREEMIFPMHRNLGVFTSRDVPLKKLFCQWQGKANGFTKGRDRSFHFGTLDHHIAGMISHLGPQLSLASGVALAHLLQGENKISLAFTGEGGTSEGEFHEALNVASVWQLPVLFVIENNGYGLSTPTHEQYASKQLADRGLGYGIEALTIDGNNILEVFSTISKLSDQMRNDPRPFLLECMTFRQRGHEEASGTKYVPDELMSFWKRRDPVKNYEEYLFELGLLSDEMITAYRDEITAEIESALHFADRASYPIPDKDKELDDVYAPSPAKTIVARSNQKKELRFIDAIAEAHDLAMERHQDLVLMGQDIAEYGGVFKITKGLIEKYGRERVRNTPLCESAIIGIALGLSMKGIKSMVEMQFADFVSCGFNQIVNNLAKIHYRWGVQSDVVIRMPCGGSVGAGPFHSQTNEAWFFKVPGLKIVYPSNPADAKGLLLAAFEDPNPVLFFEHKALYRKASSMVYSDYYTIGLGKAAIVRTGTKATIVTYGLGVQWAQEAVVKSNEDVEIVDLRTLSPLDYDTISNSVIKTHRVLVLHEDTLTGGIGAEISAYISQHLFKHLDAPVIRVASMDTPVPFESGLEKQFLANSRLDQSLMDLLNY